MIILHQYPNSLELQIDGEEDIRVIDITFKGKFHAQSLLPDNWGIQSSQNRMICMNFYSYDSTHSNPSVGQPQGSIFNYSGNLLLKNITAYDIHSNKINVSISIQNNDIWDTNLSIFDESADYYTSYNKSPSRAISKINAVKIVKNNLLTNSDEFYFEDGTPYQGDYHTHENGQAMTGGEHSRNSKDIHRKDANGNIVKIKSYKPSSSFSKLASNLQVAKNKTSAKTSESFGTGSMTGRIAGRTDAGTGDTSGGVGGGGGY